MKNEIVTFTQGYDLTPGVRVFVNSALRHSALTVIEGKGNSPGLINYLKERKKTSDTKFPINVFGASLINSEHNVNTKLSPYTLKVIYFYLYCKHYTDSDNVFLCDFNDIFVQRNPFELIKDNKVYVSSENCLVKDCDTNNTWIKLCYNQDIYNLLKDKEIINGGNILGNRLLVIDLLKEMCSDMEQILQRIGNYCNIDQASLIKSVYFDSERYILLKNKEILNMAHNNQITDLRDYYIVHQYKVNKDVTKTLHELHSK